ncbi:hypothetical protein RUND412_010630 [Rhizina undulata]
MSALPGLRAAVARTQFATTASSKNFRTPLFRYLHASAVAAAPKFRAGQKILYHPIGALSSPTTTGVITRVLTEPGRAGTYPLIHKASPDDPRYEIKNLKTGKFVAVKEIRINRVLED